jgi:sugar transferase (PEP-CTERM/EpsH1 system associated)
MKLLFLTPVFPFPLDGGGKIKAYFNLKILSGRYNITLVSFIRSGDERKYFSELYKFCGRIEVCLIKRSFFKNIFFILLSFFTDQSFIIRRDYVKKMQMIVDKIIREEKPDLIYVDHLQMFQYVKNHKGFKILDEHNVENLLIKRLAKNEPNYFKKIFLNQEQKKLMDLEKNACLVSDLVLTVSDVDKEILSELASHKVRIESIPIGVDCEYFSFKPRPAESEGQKKSIIFIGTLFWPPNIDAIMWFLNNVRPLIREKTGNVNLKIIGNKPVRKVAQLAKFENIEILGNVQDVRPFMRQGNVFIVPLRIASGMRVKILNAMACGIPVVSTSIGVEGVEVKNGENILIADTPKDFADNVIKSLDERDLSEKISLNARRLVEEKYEWRIVGKKINELFSSI